jgi:hypothetical protein
MPNPSGLNFTDGRIWPPVIQREVSAETAV